MGRAVRFTSCLPALLLPAAGLAANLGFDPPLVQTDDIHCAESAVVVRLAVSGPVEHLQGFSVTFRFDPRILQAVAVRPGDVLTEQPAPVFFWPYETEFPSGRVQIDAAVLGTTVDIAGDDGPCVLAEIELRKLGCGTVWPCATALELLSTDLRDDHNQAIPIDAHHGRVEVKACTLPVRPATWGRIKATHRR
jgi:hypothetical protein